MRGNGKKAKATPGAATQKVATMHGDYQKAQQERHEHSEFQVLAPQEGFTQQRPPKEPNEYRKPHNPPAQPQDTQASTLHVRDNLRSTGGMPVAHGIDEGKDSA